MLCMVISSSVYSNKPSTKTLFMTKPFLLAWTIMPKLAPGPAVTPVAKPSYGSEGGVTVLVEVVASVEPLLIVCPPG